MCYNKLMLDFDTKFADLGKAIATKTSTSLLPITIDSDAQAKIDFSVKLNYVLNEIKLFAKKSGIRVWEQQMINLSSPFGSISFDFDLLNSHVLIVNCFCDAKIAISDGRFRRTYDGKNSVYHSAKSEPYCWLPGAISWEQINEDIIMNHLFELISITLSP